MDSGKRSRRKVHYTDYQQAAQRGLEELFLKGIIPTTVHADEKRYPIEASEVTCKSLRIPTGSQVMVVEFTMHDSREGTNKRKRPTIMVFVSQTAEKAGWKTASARVITSLITEFGINIKYLFRNESGDQIYWEEVPIGPAG